MPVPTTLRGISTTASANSPAGSDTIGSSLDDYLRSIQAVFRQFLASQGTNMASAATVDLATADGYYINVTGNTTMTGLGTEAAGISYLLKFASTPQLTHSSSLILPGAANITAAAGDSALFMSEGAGTWRCVMYQPVTTVPAEKIPTTKGDLLVATAAGTLARVGVGTDGKVLTAHASAASGVSWATPETGITIGSDVTTTSGTAIALSTTIPAGTKRITVMFVNVSTNGVSPLLIQIGDAGGIEATGYTATADRGGAQSNQTIGFVITETMSSSDVSGSITLSLQNASTFTWVSSGVVRVASGNVAFSGGSKSLTAELTQLRLTTVNGTDTFDAGLVSVSYE